MAGSISIGTPAAAIGSSGALAIGIGASASGQALIRFIVESDPDVRLVDGVPLVLIVGVVAMAIVVERCERAR